MKPAKAQRLNTSTLPVMSPTKHRSGTLRALLACAAVFLAACSGGDNEPSVNDPGDTETSAEANSAASPGNGAGQSAGTPDTAPEPDPIQEFFTPLGEPGVGGRITSLAFDPVDVDRLFVGGDLLGIALTNDFGQSWQSTTGLASWEIADINATPSADGRIWTGSLSGPQSSTDGVTWALTRNGMPELSESRFTLAVETVLIDVNNNSRLLAFNGNQRNWTAPGAISPTTGEWDGDGSVWESLNSGQSWTQLGTVAPAGNIRAAAQNVDGTLLYAAVGNRGVFVSGDGGASWNNSGEGLPHANPYDITAHPTDPLTAWVSMGEGPEVNGNFVAGGIWRTTDGGATWTAVNSGLQIVSNATASNTGSFHQIVVSPSAPDTLFTSNVAPGQAAIYRSVNSGDSWSVVADSSTSRPNAYQSALRAFDIAVHPTDPNRVAIGSDDTLLGSTDGGDTWTDLTTEEGQSGFFSGRGYSGLVSTDIVFNPADPDEAILLGFDGGNFIQTLDGGRTWRRTIQDISAWGGGVEAAYSPTNPDQIYVLLGQFSNFRGIGVSSNGGTSFDLSVGANSGLPEIGNLAPGADGVTRGATGLAVVDDAGTDLVFATVSGTLYRSDDNASSFRVVDGLTNARDVAATVDGTVFATTASGAFISTDGGLNFAPAGNAPVGVSTLYTSASEPGIVYAVAFREGDGGVYQFDGTDWNRIFEDFFAHGIAIDPNNPDNLAVVTTEQPFNDVSSATGVHVSNDAGQTWTAITEGLPLNRLRTAEFDPANPDRLVVGTTGRGFYHIDFTAVTGNG